MSSKHRRMAACLYEALPSIEQEAGEYGQLMQDDRCERYEWVRLVAWELQQAEAYALAAEERFDRLERRDEMRGDDNGDD